jgi:hypothetical protein
MRAFPKAQQPELAHQKSILEQYCQQQGIETALTRARVGPRPRHDHPVFQSSVVWFAELPLCSRESHQG